MLCKDDECDGYERKHDFTDARPSDGRCSAIACSQDSLAYVAVYEFFNGFDKSKVGIVQESGYTRERAVLYKVFNERFPVDYLEVFDVEAVSENREE